MSRILDISSKLSLLYFLLIVDIYVVYHITNLWATTLALLSINGAEAILKLRSLKVSGEFDDYWKFYEKQEFIKNHFNKYADPTFLNVDI
ncbi:hypothetical protein TI05_11805 [Achromatium sp. WMS3]|nr:hypothetical protein TI05_11805 [Achromatium sp. WMS3]